jgi:hypothetical protein
MLNVDSMLLNHIKLLLSKNLSVFKCTIGKM